MSNEFFSTSLATKVVVCRLRTRSQYEPDGTFNLTYRGDEGSVESVVGVSEQHARLSDARVAYQQQLEQEVVGLFGNR